MTDLFISPIANVTPDQIRDWIKRGRAHGWGARRPVRGLDGKQLRGHDGKPLWKLHQHQDFPAKVGTPVRSMADGVVTRVLHDNPSAGNMLVVAHTGAACHFTARYLHNSQLTVKIGARVMQGDTIALSGNTGASTGPHLDFNLALDVAQVPVLSGLGLRFVGRDDPGCGGRLNVPVECFLRVVWEARQGEGWAWLGEC